MVWPAVMGRSVAGCNGELSGQCLQLLLQRELLGAQPCAQQQLRPFLAAQQGASSSRSRSSNSAAEAVDGCYVMGVQWPLLPGLVCSSSSTGCRCLSPTCHLCTPPPPVTLQQLQLVLEVVCLTRTECTQQALQAPLLLALLLQRASPGVRAEFLNSADGVRLLVAMQHAPDQTYDELVELAVSSIWCMYPYGCAVSKGGVPLKSNPNRWLLPAVSQAVSTLAWCFLQLDPGAGASAADPVATAAGTARAAAGPEASVVSPAAVEQGCLLHFNILRGGECCSLCSAAQMPKKCRFAWSHLLQDTGSNMPYVHCKCAACLSMTSGKSMTCAALQSSQLFTCRYARSCCWLYQQHAAALC
jgi:hypothetical protein